MAADLTADVFSAHLGGTFDAEGLPLVLVAVDADPARDGFPRRVPFRLLFTGPAGARPGQRTYRLRHDVLGELDVFLVPVQPGSDGLPQLEAVFG